MRTGLRTFLGIAVLGGVLASLGGCSTAFVNNPRRTGLDCSKTPFWPIVDAAVAIAGTAFLVTQGTAADEPVTLIAPGVFVLSSVWGSVKVGRCRSKWSDATPEQIAAFHKEQAEQEARAAQQRAEENARLAEENARLAEERAAADAAAQQEAQARADADAQARANAEAQQASAPAPAAEPAPVSQQPARYERYNPQPAVTVTRESKPIGVWNATSRDACQSKDWVAKSGLKDADARIRTQVMRDACTKCVDQGKRFSLHEEGKTMSTCN